MMSSQSESITPHSRFLQDIERCITPLLRINVVKTHRMIAHRCIEVIDYLEKDICKVHSYGTFISVEYI